MKKIYKVIEGKTKYDKLTIYGSNRSIKLRWGIPEWRDKRTMYPYENTEEYFIYQGRRYYLSEFMVVGYPGSNPPDWMKEFDGYCNYTSFSGILIKMCRHTDGEDGVKAFTYIG